MTDTVASSRLRRLARRSTMERESVMERCELCGQPIPDRHRHLMNLDDRELMCACQACTILFGSKAASAGHYRLVPDRRLRLTGFDLSDLLWEELRLPVEMAFFFRSSREGRVMAYYPSPMGPTESQLRLEAWEELEAANPVVATLEPDVEALLVNRARGAREYLIVPIDDCYALVGLIRTGWRGLTGGKEVWERIGAFFEDLNRRAKEVAWPTG
jgi:Family of unknown function (DUF5947)